MEWQFKMVHNENLKNNTMFQWEDEIDDTLSNSIKEEGIKMPLVVREYESEKYYILVDGFKRNMVIQKINEKVDLYPCLIINSNINLLDTAFWRLENFTINKKISGISVLRIVDVFKYLGCDDELIIKKILPKVSLPSSRKILDDLCKLKDKVDFKNNVLINNYSCEDLLLLLKFSKDEIQKIINLGNYFKLGSNKWKGLLQLLDEISRLLERSVIDILDSDEITQILNNLNLQPPVCWRLVRQQLENWRYPELTKCRQEYDSLINSLKLPNTISIQYDPVFEKEEIQVALKCSSSEQLKTQCQKILENIDSSKWKEIFRIIRGL